MSFPTTAKLTGMVQAFQPDKRYIARSLFANEVSESDKFAFDKITFNRTIAPFRNPDSVAGSTAMTQKARITANLHTLREKKLVHESLLRWQDAPGKLMGERFNDLLNRELMDLADVLDRTWEKYCWDLLRTGIVAPSVEGVSSSYNFGLGGSATAGTSWKTIATSTPLDNLIAAKKAVRQAWGEEATEVYMSTDALNYLMQATTARAVLGESTKDAYAVMGTLEKVSGLKIILVDSGYYSSGSFVPYLSDNATDGNIAIIKAPGPVGQFVETKPVDSKAPENVYGRFAKVFEQEDPAGRFLLVTQTALPGLTMPNKVYALKLWT